ncbi:hypothetical protein B0H13DRAFT_1871846 [Mycena leptocephala]|nr:hypothetical protein B0H13DRAFT_1871846 [Mycena leptocephala]
MDFPFAHLNPTDFYATPRRSKPKPAGTPAVFPPNNCIHPNSEFHPKNHTVTQSSFLDPCKALAETSTTGQVGFKSGFQPVETNATEFPVFAITINHTTPIWVYYGQQGPPVHGASGMILSTFEI